MVWSSVAMPICSPGVDSPQMKAAMAGTDVASGNPGSFDPAQWPAAVSAKDAVIRGREARFVDWSWSTNTKSCTESLCSLRVQHGNFLTRVRSGCYRVLSVLVRVHRVDFFFPGQPVFVNTVTRFRSRGLQGPEPGACSRASTTGCRSDNRLHGATLQ